MDYSKIYSNFIADRRSKESVLVESNNYSECHHIVPRAIGGDDAPDNLITLTPEDHFFAHLLLAKIHGGNLWAPIAFMVGGSRKDYKPTISRIAHGWAKRALAKSISGCMAYQFDSKIYSIEHKDGRQWTGLQSEIPVATGLSKSMSNMLVKKSLLAAKGWFLKGSPPPERYGLNHPMTRKDVQHFHHVDGRCFIGTQYEFHLVVGVSKVVACKLARGMQVVCGGWHLKGSVLPSFGRGAKWNTLHQLNAGRKYACENGDHCP